MFENLFEPLRNKWATYSQRDQRSLSALMVALVLAILIFGITLPVLKANKQLHNELENAQDVYNELLSLAPLALINSSEDSTFDTSSLNSEVRRQAARFGVDIQRFEPDGNSLKVWLEDVRYPAVIQWLGGLTSRGIGHSELTLEDRPKAGFVSVRVTLGARN
jgi:type II secretory pathway component PulM